MDFHLEFSRFALPLSSCTTLSGSIVLSMWHSPRFFFTPIFWTGPSLGAPKMGILRGEEPLNLASLLLKLSVSKLQRFQLICAGTSFCMYGSQLLLHVHLEIWANLRLMESGWNLFWVFPKIIVPPNHPF